MKKSLLLSSMFSLFLVMGCSNNNDYLSGKTFDLAYPPAPDSEGTDLNDHHTFMTLSFDNGEVTRVDGNEVQGEYTLSEDGLIINFEHDEEELTVEFEELSESEKEFSSYTTNVTEAKHNGPDGGLNHLSDAGHALSNQLPIEFIEEE